jgi:hypothetical protein
MRVLPASMLISLVGLIIAGVDLSGDLPEIVS